MDTKLCISNAINLGFICFYILCCPLSLSLPVFMKIGRLLKQCVFTGVRNSMFIRSFPIFYSLLCYYAHYWNMNEKSSVYNLLAL